MSDVPAGESMDEARPDDWDIVPTGQRMLIEMINGHMERQTIAVTKLGDDLPDKVAAMGTAMAKELRIGLRNQSIAFFMAFMVLVVAVVALAGSQLEVRADMDGIQVGTARAADRGD